MPKLSQHQSSLTTKLLYIGDSGAGKSGSLASLAGAGYNLRIVDLDNGIDVLKNILEDPKSAYGPKALDQVDYETITDTMKTVNGRLVPGKATVWQRVLGLLDNWPGYGSITTWTPQDILVIDSLTMLSTAALNFVLSMNGRLGQRPQLADWGDGQGLIESFVQKLYDESVVCNIVVCAHVTYLGEEGNQRGYPNTLGKALPPKLGRYFNTVLMAKSVGQGSNIRRKILTNTSGVVELKNTAPSRVKPEYELATGLAEYFAAVKGEGAKAPVTGVAQAPRTT